MRTRSFIFILALLGAIPFSLSGERQKDVVGFGIVSAQVGDLFLPTAAQAQSAPAGSEAEQRQGVENESSFPTRSVFLIAGLVALIALAWFLFFRKNDEPPAGGPRGGSGPGYTGDGSRPGRPSQT